MKKWTVRAVSLYVFNVVVLLLIGLLMSSVSVGWNALWAAVILTVATLALKPTLLKVFRGAAAKSAQTRTNVGEKVVQYGLVFIVELVVWVLTVWLSGVDVRGWFWGYVLPPLYLLIAWVIYDLVDDRIETKAGAVFDTVQSKVKGGRTSTTAASDAGASAGQGAATAAGREELDDGLTPEQRRMLNEL
ncbi:hypothetical protein [Microbacterium murale]|uniref:Uncharacterized membrane protein YvlD (DUF360 family) n=1 Tax=Microbacterium murale TaxID=1081040 RepID=A0ABU0PDI0_9MICO|nr:hypothetical protein [Microbacterium murale]MDQ0644741.1 uncharacterized membrane protein YvlD (DUF360 family) [Microbacterium murale]